MAHLMIDLLHRHQLVGSGEEDQFDCPLTQYDLADALGLTSVHVNRVLRQLREGEILTFRHQSVVIHDIVRLAVLADYDLEYFDQPLPKWGDLRLLLPR